MGKIKYSVTDFCKHNEGLILPSVDFLAGAICEQEPQPGVLQVVWVSDSTVLLHGCLCCTNCALCWSPLVLSAHSLHVALLCRLLDEYQLVKFLGALQIARLCPHSPPHPRCN